MVRRCGKRVEQTQSPSRSRVAKDAMAAEWPDLTQQERDTAIEAARREGRRAARWFLAESADGGPAPLRDSRWARKQGGLERTSDRAVHRLALLLTMPVEHDYVDHVID